MRTAFRPSLVGAGRPEPDAGFGGLRRRQLDGTSWVDLAPGRLDGSDTLVAELVATAPWQQRERRPESVPGGPRISVTHRHGERR